MHVSLMNGNDTFRRIDTDNPARVAAATLYGLTDDGFKPLYVCHSKKEYAEYGESKINSSFTASSRFPANTGKWFKTTNDIKDGTLILVQLSRSNPALQTSRFSVAAAETTVVLLRCNSTAALWRIVASLPEHRYAEVPNVEYVGRFDIIKQHKELLPHELIAVTDMLGEDDPYVVEAYTSDEEYENVTFTRLERAPIKQVSAKSNSTGGVRIKRRRRIKVT